MRQGRPPRFVVELYPYANLAHTLRLREDVAVVRLSDILADAPVTVIEAAAAFFGVLDAYTLADLVKQPNKMRAELRL